MSNININSKIYNLVKEKAKENKMKISAMAHYFILMGAMFNGQNDFNETKSKVEKYLEGMKTTQ